MKTNALPSSLRLFFALWPDDATRAALLEIQQAMRGRPVQYENLHLTLAFLGQQPTDLLTSLKNILLHLPTRDVAITVDRVGYFPNKRIAWAGLHEVPRALIELQRALMDALERNGISVDAQSKFTPHLTLMRNAEPPPDMAFTPIRWRAEQLVLVQSVTGAEGSRYEVLASRSLSETQRTRVECRPPIGA